MIEKMHPEETQSYVEALEAERMKMLMFKRELPLSLDLVSQAIESCRQNMCDSLSEETTSGDVDVNVPVLEFIPIKKCTNESFSESEEIRPSADIVGAKEGEKLDWLSSAQLWNKSSESEELRPKELDNKKSEEKSSSPKQAESSSADFKKEVKEGSSKRKQRRCWSQDLHRRFLHSLKELGGAHVATPKQIREWMKVDGLTNDEVKSHLQKYRLHTRRPTSSLRNNRAPSQFVVAGNIWAPQSDYSTSMALSPPNSGALSTSRTRVYTPMAATLSAQPHSWKGPLIQKPQIKSQNPDGHADGLFRCISLSMSSSMQTTASHVY